MYKVIICDDNKLFLKVMVMLLEKYKELYEFEIETFSTGESTLEYCRENAFDIIYMDIELDKKLEANNGMDFAKILKIINPQSLIIYVSSYDSYYKKMVNAEPFRFIERDMQDMEQFGKSLVVALDAAIKRIKGEDLWIYSYERQQYSIELTQIAGVYSFARKIHIISLRKIEQYFYYGKLEDIQHVLEKESEKFVKINKKTIVNVSYVRRMKNKVKIGGKIFSISPEYRELFNERFLKYRNWTFS